MATRPIKPELVLSFRHLLAERPGEAIIVARDGEGIPWAMAYLEGKELTVRYYDNKLKIITQRPYWPDPSRGVVQKSVFRSNLIYLDFDSRITDDVAELLQNIHHAKFIEWVPSGVDLRQYSKCKKEGKSTEHLNVVANLVKIFEDKKGYNCILHKVRINPDGPECDVEFIYLDNKFALMINPKTYLYTQVRRPNKLTAEERANMHSILYMIQIGQITWKEKVEFQRPELSHIEMAAYLRSVFADKPPTNRLVQYIDHNRFETHLVGDSLRFRYVENGQDQGCMYIHIKESSVSAANYDINTDWAITLEKIFVNIRDDDHLEWIVREFKPDKDPATEAAERQLKHDKIRADQRAILDKHVFKTRDGQPDHANFANLARELAEASIHSVGNLCKFIMNIFSLIEQKVSEIDRPWALIMSIPFMGVTMTLRIEKKDGTDHDVLACNIGAERVQYIDPLNVSLHPYNASILSESLRTIRVGITYWRYYTRSSHN